MLITDLAIRALIKKAQKEGATKTQAHGLISGLTLSASKTGTAAWTFRYYVEGKRKEVTIGQYPEWSIAGARDKASELRRNVDQGVDVAVAKQMAKLSAVDELTVDGLAEAYFAKAEKEMVAHTLKQRKSVHRRFVSPHIGNFKAKDVIPAHVVDVVRKGLDGGKTLPKIVLLHVTQLYHYAVGNAICTSNPCRDVRESAVIGKGEPPALRIALTAAELSAFLPALATIPRNYALAVRLMLLTGVRVGTMTEALAAEFDLEECTWSVPHVRRKNRRHTSGPFVIPLPTAAVGWVREMLDLADGDDYLLPVESRRHTDARNKMSKRTTIGEWLDRMRNAHDSAWRRITPHDLRSTCKSWLSSLRVHPEIRDRYLDHALQGMNAIYDQADYREHLLSASEKYLEFLDNCESGKEPAKVIRLQNVA
jgi:integrase